MPSPVKHPAWYSFKTGPTYRNLNIEEGRVELKVLTSETGRGRKGTWLPFEFRPDARLRLFTPSSKEGKGKRKWTYQYYDKKLETIRRADIKGIKLLFKNLRGDKDNETLVKGTPYLVFTCVIEDEPARISLRQDSFDKYSPGWLCQKVLEQVPLEQLVTCAVDLGIRHLGTATVMNQGRVTETCFLRLPGVSLAHIAGHKRRIAKGRKRRGRPVKGERSFVDLQDHITHMGEDRFKKGAEKIVAFARENGAQLIILEKLKGLVPDAERERGINRALVNWNRGNTAKWVKFLAQDSGLRVIEVRPHHSSQVCSKCGHPGTRYDIKGSQPQRERMGKLFACYNCGYRANADFNASVNLHKIFLGEFAETKEITYNAREARLGGKKYNHSEEWEKLLTAWGVEAGEEDIPF